MSGGVGGGGTGGRYWGTIYGKTGGAGGGGGGGSGGSGGGMNGFAGTSLKLFSCEFSPTGRGIITIGLLPKLSRNISIDSLTMKGTPAMPIPPPLVLRGALTA